MLNGRLYNGWYIFKCWWRVLLVKNQQENLFQLYQWNNYGVLSQLLLAAMKDQAAVNEMVDSLFTLSKLIAFEHWLLFSYYWPCRRALSDFITSCISQFSHSSKMRFLWLEQTGKSMATYSPTCWWNRWEVNEQISVQCSTFLWHDDLGSATTTAKLLTFFIDPQQKAQLEVELAAVMD